MRPSHVKLYAYKVLNQEYNLFRIVWAVEKSKVSVKHMASVVSRGKVDSWIVSVGLVSVQTCAVHIIDFLCNVHKNTTLSKRRYILLSQLPEKSPGRFYTIIVKTLLGLDTEAQVITVQNTTIPQPNSGLFRLLIRQLVRRRCRALLPFSGLCEPG